MEIIISILAFIFSVIGLAWQAWTFFHNRKIRIVNECVIAMAQLERSLADAPNAFKFHGLTKQTIKEHGFDDKSLSYLLSNMTIGGSFHRHSKEAGSHVFKKSSYRYKLCESEEVLRAWPLIERMITETPYKDRIINTLKEIHGDKFVPTLEELPNKQADPTLKKNFVE